MWLYIMNTVEDIDQNWGFLWISLFLCKILRASVIYYMHIYIKYTWLYVISDSTHLSLCDFGTPSPIS